jgi:hypothetical protein
LNFDVQHGGFPLPAFRSVCRLLSLVRIGFAKGAFQCESVTGRLRRGELGQRLGNQIKKTAALKARLTSGLSTKSYMNPAFSACSWRP